MIKSAGKSPYILITVTECVNSKGKALPAKGGWREAPGGFGSIAEEFIQNPSGSVGATSP